MDNEVEMIAHDLESGQTTPVDIDIEQHHVQEFATACRFSKGNQSVQPATRLVR